MAFMMVGDILGGAFDSVFDTDFTMDSDLSFELFSIQVLTAATMMLGYVGMFTLQATDNEVYAVLAGGVAAGARVCQAVPARATNAARKALCALARCAWTEIRRSAAL